MASGSVVMAVTAAMMAAVMMVMMTAAMENEEGATDKGRSVVVGIAGIVATPVGIVRIATIAIAVTVRVWAGPSDCRGHALSLRGHALNIAHVITPLQACRRVARSLGTGNAAEDEAAACTNGSTPRATPCPNPDRGASRGTEQAANHPLPSTLPP